LKNILSILSVLIALGSSAYAGSNVNVSGNWVGVNYASQVSGPSKVKLYLTQVGKNITGTYWAATGVAGNGKGVMTGSNTFHMNWVNTTKSCPGKYSDDYIINKNQLTWTFTGRDCLGKETGHGYAKRD